jgi:glycosyltransferase involved in cell wall biosynthesis
MRIIVVTQYFPPETGGTQNRLASVVDGMRRAGHDVHVITEKPSYPAGIIWDEYRGGPFKSSTFRGVDVTHTWIWEDRKKSFFTRIRFFLSFVVMAIWASFRLKGPFDVVFASSPPLFVGLAGWIIARFRRAKFVFDIRDLWPDVAISMGQLRNARFVRAAKALERFLYRRADGITAVTQSFCEDIRKTAGRDVPLVRITNGTVPGLFSNGEDREVLREQFDFDGQFVTLYAGNLGLAQGLEHILEAAELHSVPDSDPDALFVLVGDGVEKERLIRRAEEMGLSNVRFIPRVPLKEAVKYMRAADVLLVPLGRSPIYSKFIPSKLFDAMAVGRPVALSVPGESRAILEAAGAGVFYEPESPEGLRVALKTLRASADKSEEVGARSRAYVSEHFDRRVVAAQLVEFLEQVAVT